MKTASLLLVISFLFCSCALNPQKVQLNPEVQVTPGNVGQGKKITIVVLDERTRSRIGNRGVIGMGADITSDEDVATIVRGKLSEGFQKQGFDTNGAEPSDPRQLRVEIRTLEYTLTPGFFSGTVTAECALKAVCSAREKITYERLCRGTSDERVFGAPFAETNEAHITKALSVALEAILNDKDSTVVWWNDLGLA